uniref:Uncharacterized protein n=1 Tax=Anguilla anguilla TaxID=7936 RepID=A0A0E9X9D2_ANGAN
MLLFKEIKQG